AMLTSGGIFVLADLIEPTTPAGKAIAGAMWDDAVRQVALASDGNLAAYDYFRQDEWNYFNQPQPADSIDQPSSLHDQLDWLRDAGFETVDIHWMRAGHVIVSGRKPS
ncbi:MAG: class I SAM-dependent methyltransferase, partial [Alphaproteobacteria bacterium]